jgi:putative hydrolase of the HAD superfamily
MIKAVFFDLYNTIVCFDPPREELQMRACREFGVKATPEALRRGYWEADDFMVRENARVSVQKLPEAERLAFWAQYEKVLLKAAGSEVSAEVASKVITRVRQLRSDFILFDDVLPTLTILRKRDLVTGLLSNLHRDLDQLCTRLGVAPYFDFLLTSQAVGSEKPHPAIFLTALERAAAKPEEAIHVGDQYYSDVIGAQRVGIMPLLLDRYDLGKQLKGCTRIKSLTEIVGYL